MTSSATVPVVFGTPLVVTATVEYGGIAAEKLKKLFQNADKQLHYRRSKPSSDLTKKWPEQA